MKILNPLKSKALQKQNKSLSNIYHLWRALNISKKKILIISIFSFYRNIFNSLLLQPFPTELQLLKTLRKNPFKNIAGKGENAGNQQFPFSNNVVYRSQNKFQFLKSHVILSANALNITLSQKSLGFNMSAVKVFWKHCGKGEIAHDEQFLLFPQCFLPFWITFHHFHQTWNCHLQNLSFWESLRFVVLERVQQV